jgi:hypothetical protein
MNNNLPIYGAICVVVGLLLISQSDTTVQNSKTQIVTNYIVVTNPASPTVPNYSRPGNSVLAQDFQGIGPSNAQEYDAFVTEHTSPLLPTQLSTNR